MGSGVDNAGISVICDADGVVVLQTARAEASLADDSTPAVADAWTSGDGRASEVGVALVKTFWFDHLDVDHRELQQIIRRAATSGKADRVRVWVRVDRQQLIRAELTATPLFDSSGSSRQVLVRTEPTRADPRRREAPEAMRKAVRTLDAASRSASPAATVDLLTLGVAVSLVRVEIASGAMLGANDAFAHLVGRPRETCANLPLSELVHPHDRRALAEAFAGRTAGAELDKPLDLTLVGEESREIAVRLNPMEDAASPGTVILIATDRSDARHLAGLEAANAQLAEASNHHLRWLSRLDKLIDLSPVGLALFENGQPIRTNPAFERHAADSGGWVDAMAHRAARLRSVAEQLSTRQAITGYWFADDNADGSLVGATISPAPAPAIELERRLGATLAAMGQSKRVAAAIIESSGAVVSLGPALANLLGREAVPDSLDALIAEASLGELRSALAQVRSTRSTMSTRLALQSGAATLVCDVTLAPCEANQEVLALFEDATEFTAQIESLRGRLALQHETIDRLEVAAAEAAEVRGLRAREVERLAQSKRLFDAFAGGSLEWDVDEGRVNADGRARELLGCDAASELTLAALLGAATAGDRALFERALFDAMASDGTGMLDVLVHVGVAASPVRMVGSVIFHERDGSRDPARFVGAAVDVSEIQRAQDSVRETAALLQLRTAELNAIFECAPDALRITTNGTMRHNAAAATLFPEGIGAMFNGDGTAPPARALAGKLSSATVSIDGDRIVMSSAAPVVSDGKIVGAVSVDRDVTDLRQLEAELRHRDEQIAGLFQNTGVGLAYLDAGGVILDANPQLSVLLGFTRADLVTKPIGGLAIDADRATLVGQLEAVLTGELTSCSSEVRLLRRGGEAFWVQLTIAPRHGNGDRSVVAIVQDVNELRVERERRVDATAQLAAARDRYDLLASTIGEGFVVLDAGGKLVEANAMARRLLALPAEGSETPLEHLTFAAPETGIVISARLPWQRAARGKATSTELVVRNGEEPPRTIEFVASPAAGRNVAINLRDVTARHAMQEDLQKAYARVVEAHTLLQQRTQQWEGSFVSAVNQLGAAAATAAPMARALAGDSRLPAELRNAAQRMVDAFRVHDRLVKHYADVPVGNSTRHTADAKLLSTMRENVDVQSLADEAMKLVSARFNVAGRMTTKFGAKAAVCNVDAALVRHALWSAFSHAASHASRAAARVEVCDVKATSTAARLRIVVAWAGRNIRAAELTLAGSLIESEGGTFVAETAGDGASATIEFELAAPGGEARRDRLDAAPKLKVLLIEDHDSTARVLSRQLARLRCEVTLATTLTQAEATLVSATNGAIDLIVCDLTMPDGDAAEFVARINAACVAAKRPPLPAVALRGYGGERDAKALKSAGFVDQLVKPVDLSALSAAIGKITPSRSTTFARSSEIA